MKCPYCYSDKNTVCGRQKYKNERVPEYHRYRKCLVCNRTFKTVEYYMPDEYCRNIKRSKRSPAMEEIT